MNFIEQAKINYYHSGRIKKYGVSSAEAMGWRDIESQQKRFQVLSTLGDFNGSVILDLGCGVGDFKTFLDQKFYNFSYLGVDQNEEFILSAKKKFNDCKETHFIRGEFSSMHFKGVDFIIASGSLNYHSKDEAYCKMVLDKMFLTAGKGLAFNMLDDQVFSSHPLLKAHPKNEILDYCKNWNCDPILIDDYLDDDFSLLIIK